MTQSNIEWTQHTWNPVVGCSIVSPGCTNCYAMNMASRIEAMNASARPGHETAPQYAGTTKKVNGHAVWTGKVALAPDNILLQPFKRKKPTTYFVNSMGDLFHEDVPDEWIDKVFAVMALSPQHTFQLLTKRAKRMRDYFAKLHPLASRASYQSEHEAPTRAWREMLKIDERYLGPQFVPTYPLPNVWLGVSTERQQEADERIPLLLQTPAAVRFISAEPLLGPIDLRNVPNDFAGEVEDWPRLDWVIVGGESGHGARPSHPDWYRSLRDECAAAGISYFFKQWGSWKPLDQFSEKVINGSGVHAVVRNDGRFVVDTDVADPPRAVFTFKVGKAKAGRLLDGVEHNAMPGAVR